MAKLGTLRQKMPRELGEPLLRHVRFGGDRRDEAPRQLYVAVDAAFELGPHEAELAEHVAAQALPVHFPVLGIGIERRHDHDAQGDGGGNEGGAPQQLHCPRNPAEIASFAHVYPANDRQKTNIPFR